MTFLWHDDTCLLCCGECSFLFDSSMPTSPSHFHQQHPHLHSASSPSTTITSTSTTSTFNPVMAQVTTATPFSSNSQVHPAAPTSLYPPTMPTSFPVSTSFLQHPHLPITSSVPTTSNPSPIPTGPDASVLSACRTLVIVLTEGGHSLLSIEMERTVLWKSRQTVERTAAAWHATHGLLSLLSRESGDATLRHNLTTFARCVDVLGYRARGFAIAHDSAPHLKLIWRPHSASSTAPTGTFSTSEHFSPVTSEPFQNIVNPNTMIVIHRDERSLSTSFARPRTASSDNFTYMISRTVRGSSSSAGAAPAAAAAWGEPFVSNQPPTPQPQPQIQTPAAIAAMSQLGMQPPAGVAAAATGNIAPQHPQTAPPTPAAAAAAAFTSAPLQSAMGEPMTHPFAPDIPVQCMYSQPMALPPMRGQSSSLPPVRELEARQKHEPQTSNMMALGLTAPMHSLAAVQPIAPPIDTRIPPSHESLFGEVQMTHSLLPVASQWPTAMPPPSGTTAMSTTTALPTLPIATVTRTRQSSRSVAASQRSCTNCGTSVTRQWVRGERSAWLCHSCGQFWRKNGYHRPAGLWNRPTFKRSRRKRTGATTTQGSSATRSSTPAPTIAPVTSTPVTFPPPTSSIGLGSAVDPLFREPGSGSGGGDA